MCYIWFRVVLLQLCLFPKPENQIRGWPNVVADSKKLLLLAEVRGNQETNVRRSQLRGHAFDR